MMKKLLKFTLALAVLTTFLSCESETSFIEDLETFGFQGTEEDIIDFLSEDAYNELLDLGITIHQGGTPPNIEGNYYMSPYVLTASNMEGDEIGKVYADNAVFFSSQDNEELSITYEAAQFNGDGEQLNYETSTESFISGTGNQFTVIVRVQQTMNGSSGTVNAENGVIVSGTKTNDGIINLETAFVVISMNGDIDDEFIDVGDGRAFGDEDGLSEQY